MSGAEAHTVGSTTVAMVKFSVDIPYSEIEAARKKGMERGLVEEKIREEAAKRGLVISGDLLESVSIVVWSPQRTGMRYDMTHPPEKQISDNKKHEKLRKSRK
jgi:hypothetical protein